MAKMAKHLGVRNRFGTGWDFFCRSYGLFDEAIIIWGVGNVRLPGATSSFVFGIAYELFFCVHSGWCRNISVRRLNWHLFSFCHFHWLPNYIMHHCFCLEVVFCSDIAVYCHLSVTIWWAVLSNSTGIVTSSLHVGVNSVLWVWSGVFSQGDGIFTCICGIFILFCSVRRIDEADELLYIVDERPSTSWSISSSSDALSSSSSAFSMTTSGRSSMLSKPSCCIISVACSSSRATRSIEWAERW